MDDGADTIMTAVTTSKATTVMTTTLEGDRGGDFVNLLNDRLKRSDKDANILSSYVKEIRSDRLQAIESPALVDPRPATCR